MLVSKLFGIVKVKFPTVAREPVKFESVYSAEKPEEFTCVDK